MKNLRIITMLLMLGSFTACKKDKTTPAEHIDLTKYCIVEKAAALTPQNPLALYLLTFNKNGDCIVITLQGEYTYKYTYENSVVKIYHLGTTDLRSEYKIENKSIVSATGNDPSFKPHLIEIPATNQFNGNRFSGSWLAEGSTLIQTANLKFTDTQFGEAAINEPVTDKSYSLVRNIAAKSSINNVMSFWILVDGRLEAQRINFNPTQKWYTGQFNKH